MAGLFEQTFAVNQARKEGNLKTETAWKGAQNKAFCLIPQGSFYGQSISQHTTVNIADNVAQIVGVWLARRGCVPGELHQLMFAQYRARNIRDVCKN